MTQENINIMIQTGRLKLEFWTLLFHYGLGYVFASMPLMAICFYFRGLIRYDLNESAIIALIIIGLIGAVAATIFYIFRYRQLKFTVIQTKLKSAEIKDAIDKTAEKWEWEIIESTPNYIYAIQKPDFITSNGNRITIILNNENVLINSVSVSPTLFFGSNVDNINTLKNNMMASTYRSAL